MSAKKNKSSSPLKKKSKGKQFGGKVVSGKKSVKYYSIDFIGDPEKAIHLTDITDSHVTLYKNLSADKLSLEGITPDVTKEEKEQCYNHILELRITLRDASKQYIHDKAVECAANTFDWRKSDGQIVTSYKDLQKIARQRDDEDNNKETWKMVYTKCFRNGWQNDAESTYMHNNLIAYRAWNNNKKVRSGFIAKIFSSELNKFRKKFPWLKFRQPTETDADGKKIRRLYNSVVEFNEEIHVVKREDRILKGKTNVKPSKKVNRYIIIYVFY